MRSPQHILIFQRELTDDAGCSVWSYLLFSYVTSVVWLGNVVESLDIGDLPILPGDMRATYSFSMMSQAMRNIYLRSWRPKPGSGWEMAYRLIRVNGLELLIEAALAAFSAVLFYVPTIFLQRLIYYFEVDPGRQDSSWGWAYVVAMIGSNMLCHIGACLSCSLILLFILNSHWSTIVVRECASPSSHPHAIEQCFVCQNADSQKCCLARCFVEA